MDVSRRAFVALTGAVAVQPTCPAWAADAYPNGPVKVIVPFGAGGVGDLITRLIGDKMSTELGSPIIVDNRAGGNSVIGTSFAARAKPDGQTILLVAAAMVVITTLQDVSYDLQRDFKAVAGFAETPLGLAVPAALNINSIDELVAYAKSKPYGLTYASGGVGSLGHLSAARLVRELNLPSTHVPFRSNNAAILSMLGGQTELLFGGIIDVIEFAKSGKLKILAVTSTERVPNLPDVPTTSELGYKDFTPTLWYGFSVPAATPGVIVDRLASAITAAASQPDLKQRFADLGVNVKLTSGQFFQTFMGQEYERWKRVVVESDIKLDK